MQQTISENFITNFLDTISVSWFYFTSKVKNLLNMKNPQVTKAFNTLVDTSEAIRLLDLNKNTLTKKDKGWREWLAGLIDGDGSFLLSKKGYASLEITMDMRDEHALKIVKNVYGGSIKLRSGAKALRYRLHHKQGLLNLINDVNGHIRNSHRQIQLNKICQKYEINFIFPDKLTFNNGWLSGFFDSCGSLDYQIMENNTNPQLYLTVKHKLYDLVLVFKLIFGGSIQIDIGTKKFMWTLDSEDQVLNFLEYVKKYPLRSSRRQRFFLIPEFLRVINLESHKAPENSILSKVWTRFTTKFHRSFHTMSYINNFSNKQISNDSFFFKEELNRKKEKSINNLTFTVKPFSTNSSQNNDNYITSKNLVVWGSFTGFRNYKGRITKQISLMYKFNHYQWSVIIGVLLSDGWIHYSSKHAKTPRIWFKQSLEKFYYFFRVFSIFSIFCQSFPSLVFSRRNNSISTTLNFFTRSLPCIKILHNMFYDKTTNKKIVPHDIYHYLDPIALSHWISGDGQRRDYGLVLCTDSFSMSDVILLVNVLIIRYNFICFIRTSKLGHNRIYISEKSMNSLRKIVKPYMDSSMLYKLNLVSKKNN